MAKKIGIEGKGLGAVFSSLIRHKFFGQSLIIPWGKDENSRGLRFRLNEKVNFKREIVGDCEGVVELES